MILQCFPAFQVGIYSSIVQLGKIWYFGKVLPRHAQLFCLVLLLDHGINPKDQPVALWGLEAIASGTFTCSKHMAFIPFLNGST